MNYIVLLSGGLDSVVNLYEARGDGKVLKALTFDYGQRSAKKEMEAASYFCKTLSIEHQLISLPWLKEITKTALVQKSETVPTLKNLDDMNEANKTAKAVWVPNRNGAFLNIGASFAESLGAHAVIPGFNKEEAATFPDNSLAFIDATNKAFELSTMSHVKVKCFTTHMDKVAMVKRAGELKIDLDRLWSCYQDGDAPCGVCESCLRTKRARNAVGI